MASETVKRSIRGAPTSWRLRMFPGNFVIPWEENLPSNVYRQLEKSIEHSIENVLFKCLLTFNVRAKCDIQIYQRICKHIIVLSSMERKEA